MNVLHITGSAGSGKTTAITCLRQKLGGTAFNLERGGMVELRARISAIKGVERVYIDCHTPPSKSFVEFVIDTCRNNRVKHLVIARTA